MFNNVIGLQPELALTLSRGLLVFVADELRRASR
jgi:hypothetical protein